MRQEQRGDLPAAERAREKNRKKVAERSRRKQAGGRMLGVLREKV